MAKITISDPAGGSFSADDTTVNRQLAAERGYTIDESLVHTIGEVARGVNESLPGWLPTTIIPKAIAGAAADAAGSKPTAELEAEATKARGGKVTFRTTDGDTFSADDTKANRELAKQRGYTPADYNPGVDGVRGATKAFAGNAQNEYLFGLPAMAVDAGVLPAGALPAIGSKAERDTLNEAHPVAAGLGGTAGVIAGMLTPGLGLGGAAVKADAYAVGKLGVEATSVAGRVVGSAARGATYAAPRAAGELVFEGDPLGAGETLLAGAGVGALFGGGSAVGKRVVRGAGKAADVAASKAEVALEARAGRLAAEAESPVERTLVDKAKGYTVDKGISKGIPMLGGAAGGLVGGPVGAAVGYGAGKVVAGGINAARKLADHPEHVVKAIGYGRSAAGFVGKHLDSIEGALNKLGDGIARSTSVESFNSMARFVGMSEDESKHKQYEAVRDKLADYTSNPQKRAEKLGQLASEFEGLHPEAVQGMTARYDNAIGYLHGVMPKDPTTPELFTPSTWKPSDNQLREYERRMQVAMDPFSVVRELQAGTLTKEHVEALDTVYPSIAGELRKRVLMTAAKPNAPKLSGRHAKTQLALLMGTPAKATSSYQSFYTQAQAAEGSGGGGGRPMKLPAAELTGAQKLASIR